MQGPFAGPATQLYNKEQGDWFKGDGSGAPRKQDLSEMAWAYGFNQAFNPQQFQQSQLASYYADPRINQLYDQQQGALGAMGGAMDKFGAAARGFNQYAQGFLGNQSDPRSAMGQLWGQAQGQGPSYAQQYGAAQAQQAQGDIARQAAMGARGGMSAADRRAAIMQSSNVGANMAAQIAAARVQERQQAMQQYLNAQAMQAQVRGQGVDAMGNLATGRINQVGAYNQPMSSAQVGYGGGVQAGQADFAQSTAAQQPFITKQ
jgi:hypothetical protein